LKKFKRVEKRVLLAVGLWVACLTWCTPSAHAAGVYLNSPSNGATVAGTVSIATSIDPGVTWIDLYIDSKFIAPSPPFTFTWDTTTVGNGVHTISVAAFNNTGQVGTASITVTVNNAAAGGTSYYVASGGKDSNSGTSQSSAWLTVNRVNSASLKPGDTVFFQAGQMWRGTLLPSRGGIPGAPITYAAFGTGNQPVISGADVVKPWTQSNGSIYSAPLSASPGNVFVDGGPPWGYKAASSVAAMAAGTWFWDSAAQLLYVWLYDSSNPTGHTVEAATREYGFYVNSGICDDLSYITINGLTFQRSYGYGIYFHCFGGNSPLTGVVIENNTVRQTGTGQVDGGQYYNGVFFLQEPWYAGAAPQILNNAISYTGGHGNGINLQGADGAVISGNNVSNWNHNGIDIKDADGVLIDSNIVHDQPSSGSALYAEQSQETVQRNIVYNASNGIQVSVGTSANVYNNSIYNSPTGIYYGPTATAIVAENNAVKGSATSFGTDGSPGLTEDYNDWGANPKLSIGPNRYTFAQWLALGSHLHDLAADPMFTSPPGNMNLLQGSPCINAGINVGLPYNGSAPDLGAMESSF